MNVREINPAELEIDPFNERNNNVGPYKGDESLEESIREQGIVQPPIAREENGLYRIIVGQRRTLAAQAIGLDKIPVIVTDWDNAEALQASITENVEGFRKAVSKSDRAAAIRRLMDLNGWSVSETGEELGVSSSTVADWVERTRDEWKDTVVHVESNQEVAEENAEVKTHPSNSNPIRKKDMENISDTDLRAIRSATNSSEEREKTVESIVKTGANQSQIREAKKRADRSENSFGEEIEKVSKETSGSNGGIQVRTEVTFTGDYAEGLQRAARDSGTSEEDLVRRAIGQYLSENGYIN